MLRGWGSKPAFLQLKIGEKIDIFFLSREKGVPNFETMVFQCYNRCKFGILQAYSSHSKLSEAYFREVLAFIVEKLPNTGEKNMVKNGRGK